VNTNDSVVSPRVSTHPDEVLATPSENAPFLDIDTLADNYNLLELKFKESSLEKFELCESPVRCTCQCNVGSFHDIMQKSAAVGLGLGLVTGAIVASVLTAGGTTYRHLCTLLIY
jgi:hypothetical protein